MSPYSKKFSKPCGRSICKGRVRRPDSTYCSRRCGFMARPPAVKITINEERGTRPKVERESWWLDTDRFYQNAREKFPEAYA